MKHIFASLCVAAPLLAGTSAWAADPAPASAPSAPAKAAVKPAAKPTPAKAVAKPAAKPVAKAPVSRTPAAKPNQLGSAAGVVTASGIAIGAGVDLTPQELAIAERVHTGRIACELGAFVNVAADPANPGHFLIDGKGFKYRMVPVTTSTGTVRLEDKHAGAVWLQISNKSMLMNQKVGQRLADECMSAEQFQVAEAIKKNPPPSVLDLGPGGR